MRSTSLLTKTIVLATAAALLSACGTTRAIYTPPLAENGRPAVGGNYLPFHFEGLPARDGMPAVPAARWSKTEYLDLQDLDEQCRRQMEPLIPSAAKEIGKLGLTLGATTMLGGGVGTALGAVNAFTGTSFKDYLVYGGASAGGSALGSGIGSGIDRYNLAKRYVQYACMQFATSHAQENGRLAGIGIIPWAGSGHAGSVPMPADNADSVSASQPVGTPTGTGSINRTRRPVAMPPL